VAVSPNGWTDQELSYIWLKDMFNPQTSELNKSDGVWLLILDGHNSHCSSNFLNYAASQHIEILCLPPHTTHALQPCDVGVFSPLAAAWRSEVSAMQSNGEGVTRQNFLQVYARARNRAVTPHNIQTAWCKTGLHPLDHTAIPDEACAPAENTTTQAALPELYLDIPTIGYSKFSVAPTPLPTSDNPLPANTIATATAMANRSSPAPAIDSSPPPLSLCEAATPPFLHTSSESPVIQTHRSALSPLHLPSFNLPDIEPHNGTPDTLETAQKIPSPVKRSAILKHLPLQATQNQLMEQIDQLRGLCNLMGCQIEANAAVKACFFKQNQQVMTKLNKKSKTSNQGVYLNTGARHLTSEGLRVAGYQTARPLLKKLFVELHKTAKVRGAATKRAAAFTVLEECDKSHHHH